MNTLYYGDNLDILRQYIPAESVDLIYLDPPFNSNRSYNVLFKDEAGQDSQAQIKAFDDTWHWGREAQDTYEDVCLNAPEKVSRAIQALSALIGTNQMLAYLVMMTARLVELHRVLKPTGSLYLHCDPTASHYLKLILDAILVLRTFGTRLSGKERRHTATQNDGPMSMITSSFIRSLQVSPGIHNIASTIPITPVTNIDTMIKMVEDPIRWIIW